MVALITWLWHLPENGFNKISIQRELNHRIESDRQASGNIDREEDVLVLVLEHKEMCSTKRNKHGSNGHKQRTQPKQKLQWQTPPKVFGLFPRSEYGKEHY